MTCIIITGPQYFFFGEKGDGKIGIKEGMADAETCGFKEAIVKGEVSLAFEDYNGFRNLSFWNLAWVRGFFSTSIEEIGGWEIFMRLTIQGKNRHDFGRYIQRKDDVSYKFMDYLRNVDHRRKKAKENKILKKKVEDGEWEVRKMFVPEIGTRLRLAKDWSFRLFCEHRNMGLYEQLKDLSSNPDASKNVKLLKGTELSVSRIYIRQGAKDYSSLTFQLIAGEEETVNGNKYKISKARFWVKLSDVNEMECEVSIVTLPAN